MSPTCFILNAQYTVEIYPWLWPPLDDALDDIRDLNELALKVTSTAELIEDALALAAEKNLTAYDACYAVLAQKLDVPLVTADAPLAKAIDWAIWIGDVEI